MIAREPDELLAQARAGSRAALARLLSYAESGGPRQREVARLVYAEPPPYVIGLTGAPGAGKSTLTDGLITAALRGLPAPFGVDQISAVCVDPTSPFSGGAILGDRIRMQDHATDERVFIRSMATRGHLGGLSLAVPDALRVLGAAGFPVVLVETVGVGQLEVEIASAADATVVVTNPGWGDAMQASKAGLLEVADLFVINKADRPGVRETRRDLEQMMDLGAERPWRPPVLETVASSGQGIVELWDALTRHRQFQESSGELVRRRHERTREELARVLAMEIESRLGASRATPAFDAAVEEVAAGRVDPYRAAEGLLAP